jgi:hypothetical protein
MRKNRRLAKFQRKTRPFPTPQDIEAAREMAKKVSPALLAMMDAGVKEVNDDR